jgi:predicted transcriptional regulator
MTRLTVSLDDELLRSARSLAKAQGTSVAEVVRGFLTDYVSCRTKQIAAAATFIKFAESVNNTSDSTSWTREEINHRSADV